MKNQARPFQRSIGPMLAISAALLASSGVSVATGQEALYQAYFSAASKAFESKDYATAETFYVRALEVGDKTFGSEQLRLAETSFNLGQSLFFQGKYTEAQRAFTRTYKRTQSMRTKAEVELAGLSGRGLAVSLINLKRGKEALPIVKWKLANDKKAKTRTRDLGHSLWAMSKIYFEIGDYAKAREYAQLELAEKSKGNLFTTSEVNETRISLAWISYKLLDFNTSQAIFQEAIGKLIDSAGTDRNHLADVYYDYAKVCNENENYMAADEVMRKALAIYESLESVTPEKLATAIEYHAGVLYSQEKYPDGDKAYRRAITLRESQSDTSKSETLAYGYERLGWSALQQGEGKEAAQSLKKSMEIRKSIGSAEVDCVPAMHLLAKVLVNDGQVDEAESLYKAALSISSVGGQSNWPSLNSSLKEIAFFYHSQGKAPLAEETLSDALKAREAAVGGDHAGLGPLITTLAQFYSSLGRHDKAEEFFTRAITNRERAVGPDHPDVASRLSDLGEFYEVLGRYRDAQIAHRRALDIRERKRGPRHLQTASSLGNLAWVCNRLREYKDAQPLAKRSLEIYETLESDSSESVAGALNRLAVVTEHLGDNQEAERLYNRSLRILEVVDPDDCDEVLNNLAGVYASQHRYEEALQMYKRSIEMADKPLKAGSTLLGSLSRNGNRARTYGNLASLEQSLDMRREARTHFEKAIAITEEAFGARHRLIIGDLRNLGDLEFNEGDSISPRRCTIVPRKLLPNAMVRNRSSMPGPSAILPISASLKGDLPMPTKSSPKS